MNRTGKRIVVFGGGGFLGQRLVRALVANSEVVVVDRNAGIPFEPGLDVKSIFGDYREMGFLEEVFKNPIDVVVHLISTTVPKTSNENVVVDVESNLLATLRLLDLCVQSGVKRVVFASTGGAIYGNPVSLPIREDHPTNPRSSYGIVKIAVEKYLQLYNLLHGLSYCALRVSNPYGPGQNPAAGQGVVAAFIGKLLRGETIEVWGDGTVVRDFVYIDDVVDAFVKGVYSEVNGIFNVGSGVGCSIRNVIERLEAVAGTGRAVEYKPGRLVDVQEVVLDIEKAKTELAWQPKVSLEQGVKRTWVWYKSNPGGF